MMKKFAHWLEQSLVVFYIGLFSVFFGFVISASVTGTAGIFNTIWSWVLAALFAGAFLFAIVKTGWLDHYQTSVFNANTGFDAAIQIILDLAAISLFTAIFLLPLLRWPESVSGNWFPWDAGKYHFPKAVELFRSGSVNDLSIDYGEYPFGYESLLSFGLLITQDLSLFGLIHVLIDLFALLTIWLLARRYTQISPPLLLFLTALMLVCDDVYKFLNFWQVFYPEFLTVGKNDLFLAASVLAAILFFPYPKIQLNTKTYYLPYCAAGALAVAIKPNSIFVIAILWLILAVEIITKIGRKNRIDRRLFFRCLLRFALSSLLFIPAFFWLIRNVVLTGNFFSETALEASKWSIAANLSNPFFYNYISKNLIIIVAFTITVLVLGFTKLNRLRWPASIHILLLIGFIITPVSAFFLQTDVPAEINWRFGEALLIYFFIMLLFFFETLFKKLQAVTARTPFLLFGFGLFIVGITVGLFFNFSSSFERLPENQFIIRDQFAESVGNGGYHSAYDFIQRNVRNSVIWVENGLPFYAYDPDFSNTISRRKNPDYVIAIKRDWFGEGGVDIPAYFPADWQKVYEVVYEDQMGIVYYNPD
jgi:hypothetical protein